MKTFGDLLLEADELNDPEITRKSDLDILKSPAGKYMTDDSGEQILKDEGNEDGVDSVPVDVENDFYGNNEDDKDPLNSEEQATDPAPDTTDPETTTPATGEQAGDDSVEDKDQPQPTADDTIEQKTFKDYFNTETPETGKFVTESMVKAKVTNEVSAISQMVRGLADSSNDNPIVDALDSSIVAWVNQEIQQGISILNDEVKHIGEEGLTVDSLKTALDSASTIIKAQMEHDDTFDNVSNIEVVEWVQKFRELVLGMFTLPEASDNDYTWADLENFSSVAMATAKSISGASEGGVEFVGKQLQDAISALADGLK